MDRRTTYSRLKKMVEEVTSSVITIHDLRALIMMNIGSDERTIQTALRVLGGTGLIKDIGDCRFEINNDTHKGGDEGTPDNQSEAETNPNEIPSQ